MTAAKLMLTSGEWVKDGKTYRHASGAEIRYDHNRFGWEFGGRVYKTLEVAKWQFEQSRK